MKLLNKYSPVLTGLLVFIIYLISMAPSVVEIDAGELAAVQATLGIAHPTGYPLFTMLGYIFLKLPLGFSKIFMANLMAGIWCSLGIMLFGAAGKLILDNMELFSFGKAEKH
ncbi:MAG: protein O-mannosyl-transferase family, partial [Syntrophothermus sp.]